MTQPATSTRTAKQAPAAPQTTTPQTSSGAPESAYHSSGGVSAFYDGPSGQQKNTGKGTTGQSGPRRSMSDLSPTQQASIRAAVNRAIQMVPRAIAACERAKDNEVPAVTRAFKLSGSRSDKKKACEKAIANYQKVASALAGNLSFEGEREEPENGLVTIAYVYTGFASLFDGDIHICFPGWDQLSPDGQAATIIHELTHQKCGTDDNAYMHETAKWASMSTKDALNNAASYEYLALNS